MSERASESQWRAMVLEDLKSRLELPESDRAEAALSYVLAQNTKWLETFQRIADEAEANLDPSDPDSQHHYEVARQDLENMHQVTESLLAERDALESTGEGITYLADALVAAHDSHMRLEIAMLDPEANQVDVE